MRRRSLYVLGAVGLLLALAVAAVVLVQDPDRYRDEVASLLSEALGHPVTLDGPLALAWRPTPTLSASRVGVATPAAGIVLESVRLRLEPGALLARRLHAREIRIDGVTVDLGARSPAQVAASIPDPARMPVDLFVVDDVVVRRGGEPVLTLARLTLEDAASPRGAKVNFDLAVAGARVTGRVRLEAAADRVALGEMVLDTPLGRVEGRLGITPGAPRTRIDGELAANAIVVRRLRAGAGAGAGRRLVPARPLDPSLLAALDGSVRVRIGRLTLGGIRLSDVTVPITVEAGRLHSAATARFAGGAVDAAIRVDAAGNDWSLALDVKQADAGDALGMVGVTNAEKGGRLDLQAELAAEGADTRALVASLAGYVNVDAAQIHLAAGSAAFAGSDVLASLGRLLSGGDRNRVRVECAVVRFSLRDGVATSAERIAAQTRTMNVRGGGHVSLADERLDLVFRPWPREGLRLSATTMVGSVAVTGPLTDPRVGLSGDSALQGGVSAGAALLTGGLSLIAQGLLEHARGDAPCQDVAAARRAGGGAGVAGSLGRAADEVSGVVEGIGRSLKDMFRGADGDAGARGRGPQQ